MKKILLALFSLSALTVSSQNVANNPPDNSDQFPQVALNNAPVQVNNNNFINTDQQVQTVQQVKVQQAANTNLGNLFNPVDVNRNAPVRQQKYGQSIQVPSGGSGYSGLSGKASVKTHTHKTFEYVMKQTFKPKYKHAKHYGHKKRVKKCHSFS